MTYRLGLDASIRAPSCAISTMDGTILSVAVANKPVEDYSKVIREALDIANARLDEIEEIVANVGPGSHTGVRATVTTANALALALQIPVTGVLSLDALAVSIGRFDSQYFAIPAGKGNWHLANYTWRDEELLRLGEMQLVSELPINALFALETDDSELCAMFDARHGLIVATHHRHLATQLLVQELTSHERGKDNDF